MEGREGGKMREREEEMRKGEREREGGGKEKEKRVNRRGEKKHNGMRL